MVTSFNTLSGAWGAGWKPRATNPTTPDRPVEPKPDQRPDGQSGSTGTGKRRDRRETGSSLRLAGDAHQAVPPQQDETSQKRGL